MYVVLDKNTKEVIHINNAPLSQNLTEQDVYFQFNSETMDIGKTDSTVLPDNYKIDDDGYIVELTLNEQVEKGLLDLDPNYEVKNNELVEKLPSQKIAEGLITLLPNEKIVGSGDDEKIVDKTITEMLNENLIELSGAEKIEGEGENEKIVAKSLAEQHEEGLIQLGPNQRIVDDEIVTFTTKELYEGSYINLEEYRTMMIEYYSNLAFELREELVPDYRLTNVNLGIYDTTETEKIKATVKAFRDEFYRIKQALENASTAEEIEAVKENFPKSMVEVSI